MSFFNSEQRVRCDEIFENLKRTKIFCLKSIEFLLEQQDELNECHDNLQTTRRNAREIDRTISKLNEHFLVRFCSTCFRRDENVVEENFSMLKNRNEFESLTFDLNQFETIVRSIETTNLKEFQTNEQFETILFDQYATLFDLAKKLTKIIEFLHETIEFLRSEIKTTFEHLQSAQPRLERLLKSQVSSVF